MKILALATALIATVAVAASAEAASKKKQKLKRVAAVQQPTTVSQDPYIVIDGDGEVLGRDPDPFIRMMLRKDGSLRHQSGR